MLLLRVQIMNRRRLVSGGVVVSAALFVVWSIWLAVSVHRLQRRVEDNVALLRASTNLAIVVRQRAPVESYRHAREQLLRNPAAGRFASAVASIDDAPGPTRTEATLTAIDTLVAAVRADQTVVARTLSNRWAQMDILAGVASLQALILAWCWILIDRSRNRAEAQNLAKSQFLANMSHEIRTPISGVLGMVDLLMAGGLSPQEQREYLEAAKMSGDAMLHMLNEILDLSKIEAGRLELELAPYPLRDVLQEATRALTAIAHRKGLTLHSTVAEDVPELLLGDPHRMRQILINLIGNAVKFTERGSVTVAVTRSGEELVCAVADTGIGVPVDKQKLIFEPFRQADASASRRYAGTGLGLTISAQLLQLMGGRISVSSEPGKGSLFTVVVPLRLASGPGAVALEPTPEAGRPTRSLRILVADDNVVNQKIFRAMIAADGHEVVLVGDGAAAARTAMEQKFDAVLMDVQMPGLDGFEATGRIREQERAPDHHLWIVALTAHAMGGDRERCLAAGMDDYLTKPITRESLRIALSHVPQ
jgi:signal transduction histidine kinase/CheY-like chemotaxis protein